jgi:Ca-activated chloride channel family protein
VKTRFAECIFFGLVFLTGSSIFAQTERSSSVLVTVTVTDIYGRWISGLEQGDIKIFEGKQAKEIRSFSKNGDPVSIGIVVDRSGSASSLPYKKIDIPLSLFLHRANHKNEYFVMAFNEKQRLVSDWTPDYSVVEKKLDELDAIEPKGNTKFFDAVSLAVDKVNTAQNTRKALLIISDGQDNGSDHRLSEIKDKLKRSNITVYCVSPALPADVGNPLGMMGQLNLDSLIQLTGGKSFYPFPNELNQVIFRIAEELDYQYILEIDPSTQDGKWREIDVRLTVPDEMKKIGRLTVRSRKGYFAEKTK